MLVFLVKKRIFLLSFFFFFLGIHFVEASSFEIISKSYYGSGQANNVSKYGSIFSNQISADGRYVVFNSFASNLVPWDFNGVNDIFVRDRIANTTVVVSRAGSGPLGNGPSFGSSISADGRYVTFFSLASNLVPNDTNGVSDIFVYDRQTSTIERVSVDNLGNEGDQGSLNPIISGNGESIAFWSDASNLVPNDTNGVSDIFVYDRQTSTIERVSVDNLGNEGDNASQYPSISFDGRHVAFQSFATNIGSGASGDIFVYDRQINSIKQVSVNNGGSPGNENSRFPVISSNGRYVVFESLASNLVVGDTNGVSDVFVYDLQNNNIELVSMDETGNEGDGFSAYASISGDGKYVTFISSSTDLVLGDTNGLEDLFIRNRETNKNMRIGSGSNSRGSVSTNGSYVILQISDGTVSGDTNTVDDISLYTINGIPIDIDLSSSTIEENSSVGTSIGNFSTTDTGFGDVHTYTFGCSVAGADDESFDIFGISLLSAEVFDYETDSSYSICVQVDDGNGGVYEENLIITVNDVLESVVDGTGTSSSGGVVYGCIDNTAINHNPNATVSNGECLYEDDPAVPETVVSSVEQDFPTPVSGGLGTKILGEVKSATEFMQTEVLNNEVSQEVVSTIAITGLAAPFLFFLTTSPGMVGSTILRFLNLIPAFLGFRRKKRPWGTVFDSLTNQPISLAYVTLNDMNGRGIATAITNDEGRFGFAAPEGSYKISVRKDNYRFPSNNLVARDNHEAYGNLYFNEIIEVKSNEDSIIKNIPLDIVDADIQTSERFRERLHISFDTVVKIAFWAGAVSSTVLLITMPTTLNKIIFSVYVLILLIRLYETFGRKFIKST